MILFRCGVCKKLCPSDDKFDGDTCEECKDEKIIELEKELKFYKDQLQKTKDKNYALSDLFACVVEFVQELPVNSRLFDDNYAHLMGVRSKWVKEVLKVLEVEIDIMEAPNLEQFRKKK